MAPATRATTASAVTAAMQMTLSPPPIFGKLISSSPYHTSFSPHHASVSASTSTASRRAAAGPGGDGVENMHQPASEQLVAFAGARMEAMAAELGALRRRCTRLEAELADRDAEVLGKALESAKRSEEERDSWLAKKMNAVRSPAVAATNPEASPTTATQTPATKTSPAFTFFHTGGAPSTGGSEGIPTRGDTASQKTGSREELEAMERRARVAEDRAAELEAALEALGDYLLTVDSDGARRFAETGHASKHPSTSSSTIHGAHDNAKLDAAKEAKRLGSMSDEHGGTLARWGLGPTQASSVVGYSTQPSSHASLKVTDDVHGEGAALGKGSIQAAYDVVARLEKAVQKNGDMLAKFAAVEKEIEEVQSHTKLQRASGGRLATDSIASGFSSDSSDSDDFASDALERRWGRTEGGGGGGVPKAVHGVREDGTRMKITPAPKSHRDIPRQRRSTISVTHTPSSSATRLIRRPSSLVTEIRDEKTPPPLPALLENGNVTGGGVSSIGGGSATRQRKPSFTEVISGVSTKKALLKELAKGLTKSSSSARRRSTLL